MKMPKEPTQSDLLHQLLASIERIKAASAKVTTAQSSLRQLESRIEKAGGDLGKSVAVAKDLRVRQHALADALATLRQESSTCDQLTEALRKTVTTR